MGAYGPGVRSRADRWGFVTLEGTGKQLGTRVIGDVRDDNDLEI